MTELTITKTLFLKAPPEHVWKFLIEPAKLAIWFHEAKEELVEDGPYTLLTNTLGKEGEALCTGKVIEIVPPVRLVHSFTHEWLKGVETLCEWSLEASEGGTILTLRHSGFEKIAEGAFDMAADHDKGWDEHFTRLRRVTA